MKKLFFIAVLLGTLIFTGIFAFSYLRFKSKPALDFFETGKSYYDQGKYSEATIEFSVAVQKDGNNRNNRYYLALSLLAQKNLSGAVQQLRSLVELFPDDVPANIELGKIYVSRGEADPEFFRQARKIAEHVLSIDPKNIDALIVAGNASAGLSDIAAAVESLEKAVALDPGSVSALISLGTTRMQQKKFPEAEKAFLKAREAGPKDKTALLSLGNYYRIAGAPEKADAVFKEVQALYPADRTVYSQVADFYLRSRQFSEVERVLKAAQSANESDPAPTLDLADFYQQMNRGEDARRLLLDAKSKFPNNITLSIKIAENLMPDKRDQAKLEIDYILKTEPKNLAGQALLGEFQYQSGQFDAAEATLQKSVVLGSPFPQVHYLLGNLALRKGLFADAEDHYQKSIKVNKDFIPARLALADRFMGTGKLMEARKQIQKILELAPRNMQARLIKAALDGHDKNFSAADMEFSALAREYPDSPDVHRQLGLYYMTRGKNADAEKSFLRAMELAPQSEQIFQELIAFYLQTKQTDRAIRKLNSVPDEQKQAFHYELLGMAAEQAGKLQDSEMAYKNALEKDPGRVSAEMHLFDQYVRSGRTDDAMKRLDALALKPASRKNVVYALKGTIQTDRGDSRGAEVSYRKALELDPTTDLAANNLAYLLVQEGRDLQGALELAKGVRSRQPENADIADTLGWIYYKLGQLVLAKSQAEFAVSKQPENGEFQYHLGEIYRKNSEFAKATAALKKAANSPRDFKEKSLAAAALKEVEKQQSIGRH